MFLSIYIYSVFTTSPQVFQITWYLKVHERCIWWWAKWDVDLWQNRRVPPDTRVVGHVHLATGTLVCCERHHWSRMKVSSAADTEWALDIQVNPTPQKPTEVTYSKIVALVKAHHTPHPSVTVQRYKFYTHVTAFVAKLQQTSEHNLPRQKRHDPWPSCVRCQKQQHRSRHLTEQSLMLEQAHYLARMMKTAKQNLKGDR